MPECSAYSYLHTNNRAYAHNTAINYYGRKISYGTLFEHIESAARAYYAMGVRAGDMVMICTINTPEMVYTLYGLNRLGAVCNFVDPRTNPDAMRGYIDECGAKLVVSVDKAYPLIKKAVKDSPAVRIVLISPADSLPIALKAGYRLKNKKPGVEEWTVSR